MRLAATAFLSIRYSTLAGLSDTLPANIAHGAQPTRITVKECSMAEADNDDTPQNEHTDKPIIVGLGASAGGIHALQAFFESVPNDTGAAFVVIVHLDPQFRSELPAILAARTSMPVLQVATTEQLQPDHVYVIPPDRQLPLTDHEISTAEFDEPRGRRAPIDLFFRSLAEQHGDGFAVIMSGAGADGAIGVKDVKEAGGIILVQDPVEAEYPSMPRSAVATGMADLVLPGPRPRRLPAPPLPQKETPPRRRPRGRRGAAAPPARPPAGPHRPRLLQVQALDRAPPHHPPHAGDPHRRPLRLLRLPARQSR